MGSAVSTYRHHVRTYTDNADREIPLGELMQYDADTYEIAILAAISAANPHAEDIAPAEKLAIMDEKGYRPILGHEVLELLRYRNVGSLSNVPLWVSKVTLAGEQPKLRRRGVLDENEVAVSDLYVDRVTDQKVCEFQSLAFSVKRYLAEKDRCGNRINLISSRLVSGNNTEMASLTNTPHGSIRMKEHRSSVEIPDTRRSSVA
jgi:hypothetical protein